MELRDFGGRRVVVVASLDDNPGGLVDGTVIIEDTGDPALNEALVRAILSRDRDHTFTSVPG